MIMHKEIFSNLNKNKAQIFQVLVNILFLYFSYKLLTSLGDIYHFKKSLTLFFIIFLASLLIMVNAIVKTKIYLILGSIGLSMMQISEYGFLSNLISKDFSVAFAFISVMCIGPLRFLKSRKTEEFLKLASILSPFVVFLAFDRLVHDFEAPLYYFLGTCIVNIIISIFRQEKISPVAISEIFSAYLVVIHSQKIIPEEVTYYYLSFFIFIVFAYSYLITSKLHRIYKKIMNYTICLLPLLIDLGVFELSVVAVLLFNLKISRYFYNLLHILKFDILYLSEIYRKFQNINYTSDISFKIKRFPDLSLSFTFCIFFSIMFLMIIF
jgi:hypothetical protein